ncbi:zinc finger, CCHC-type containing protein [Tanacetum coccineum]
MAILEDGEQKVSLHEEDVGYKETNMDRLWYLDNGASNHMTGVREHFEELDEKVSGKVRFGDGSYIKIKGKGSILIECDDEKQRIISHVYYIPDLKSNLLSLGQFTEIGCKVVMEDDELRLYDMDNKIFMKVTRQRNRLYKANLRIGTPVCLLANLKEDTWLWHARLGHLNFESLRSMAQRDLVQGIPTIKHTTQVCDVCLIGKHSRAPFPKKAKARSTSPLDLVYGDLCGPITPPTPSGKKYIFLLVDDYSRYMWVYFLTTKDQAFDTFKEYKKSTENELRTTLKMLRTDRGGEFTSNEFTQYCKENGIARQLTAPYSPQQNGVVERRNRTIMSTTRCMMKATNMPQNFWAKAVRHAIYILNSVPTKALEDITPYEAIKQRKPNLENLRVFGCIAYAKVPSQHLTKLDDRSTKMVYLGNEQGSKAYRLFDPTTQRICVSRDVKFKENETWDWKDYMSELINDEPEWTDFRIGDLEATNEHHDQGFQPIEEDNEFPNNDDDDYVSPTRDSPSHSQTSHTPSTSSSQVNSQVTPNTSTQSYYQSDNDSTQIINSPSHFDHTPLRGFRTLSDLYENTEELLLAEDEPKNYKEASSDQKWIEAMKVELDSINRNNTWELTTLPKGHKAIGLKWVFKTKRDANGNIIKHKARLVAKENGIARQLTAPYSPQQNGVVERRNRTIMSTTRCMMKATNMPQNFWAEAVRHAIYILNSVPTKALEDITPYEAIKQRKPNLENLRVFGCIAYAKVPSQHLTKLDDRSTKMVYLGNEQGSKAYRLFDPTTQRVCVSRDVKFKEDETWDWKDYMSKHINDKPEWTNFKIGNLEVTNEQHDQETQPIEDDNEFPNNDDDYASPSRDSPLHSQTPHTPSTRSSEINSQVTPNFSTQSYYQSDNDSIQITNLPSHFDHTPLRGFRTLSDLYENTEELLLAENEPKNYKEASSDQKWIKAMKVELDSINRNNTWELTTLPKGHKAIGLKWVFKTKKDANGNIIKHKARLVAKGYIQ